jgi:hypothetical protein
VGFEGFGDQAIGRRRAERGPPAVKDPGRGLRCHELAQKAGLADAGLPGHDDHGAAPRSAGPLETLLQKHELSSPSHKRQRHP